MCKFTTSPRQMQNYYNDSSAVIYLLTLHFFAYTIIMSEILCTFVFRKSNANLKNDQLITNKDIRREPNKL